MTKSQIIEQYLLERGILRDGLIKDISKISFDLSLEIDCKTSAERELKNSFTRYIKEVACVYAPEYIEYYFAGTLAFIWANCFEQPYQLLQVGYPKKKKWYQFWKKGLNEKN